MQRLDIYMGKCRNGVYLIKERNEGRGDEPVFVLLKSVAINIYDIVFSFFFSFPLASMIFKLC